MYTYELRSVVMTLFMLLLIFLKLCMYYL